jgi:hypothetical protein
MENNLLRVLSSENDPYNFLRGSRSRVLQAHGALVRTHHSLAVPFPLSMPTYGCFAPNCGHSLLLSTRHDFRASKTLVTDYWQQTLSRKAAIWS